MNNHTLVTRLTFSWHAALFRANLLKVIINLKVFYPLLLLVIFRRGARLDTAICSVYACACASVIVLLSAVSHYPNSHKRAPPSTGSSGKWSPEAKCTLRRLGERNTEWEKKKRHWEWERTQRRKRAKGGKEGACVKTRERNTHTGIWAILPLFDTVVVLGHALLTLIFI